LELVLTARAPLAGLAFTFTAVARRHRPSANQLSPHPHSRSLLTLYPHLFFFINFMNRIVCLLFTQSQSTCSTMSTAAENSKGLILILDTVKRCVPSLTSSLRVKITSGSSYKSGDLSDLVITCGGDTYHVHKKVVCNRSDFFSRAIKWSSKARCFFTIVDRALTNKRSLPKARSICQRTSPPSSSYSSTISTKETMSTDCPTKSIPAIWLLSRRHDPYPWGKSTFFQ
jgi:hypothetical protein